MNESSAWEMCAFPTARKILCSSRPSFSPRVSHRIIHAAKRRKGWKRKSESVHGGGEDTSSSKKKKRRRAALSAVFIQIGGFCFRPCSRLDIHQWKFLSRLIIPGDPVRQAQFSKEFPPSLATARYFIRNCFLLPDVCRPPSTKLLPRSRKVDPFPGWNLSTTTFSNGWNSNF